MITIRERRPLHLDSDKHTTENARIQEDSLEGKMAAPHTTTESKPGLFSFEDAAKFLGGISTWTLRVHARRANIRTVHLGLRVFITLEELERIRRDGLPSLRVENGHSNKR